MKKRTTKAIIMIIIMVLLPQLNIRAENVVSIDNGDTYVITSDGQSGYDSYSDTDVTSDSTSNQSVNYTNSQLNYFNLRNNIRNRLEGYYNQIKNNPLSSGYGMYYLGGGGGCNLFNLAYIPIPRSEIGQLLNDVSDLKANIPTDCEWFNNNTVVPSSYLDTNYLAHQGENGIEITTEDLEYIKAAIIANENGTDVSNPENRHFIEDVIERLLLFSDLSVPNFFNVFNNFASNLIQFNWVNDNYYLPEYQNNTANTVPVRRDIYVGLPEMRSSTVYTERFKGLFDEANSIGYPMETRNNKWVYADAQNPAWRGSAVLNDNIFIGLLTDYHIVDIQKDMVTNINYTSDERRWTIYLNGNQVSEPLITDNPRHELNFTEVYNQYGAGDYYVVAEQLATYQKTTYVTYDTCEYLYDMRTGNVLWFSEYKVSSGRGTGIYIGTESYDTPEWLPTGDTFTITVNDLGEFDVSEDDGTNRIE